MDVDVVDAFVYYNFLLGHTWIHTIMAILSLEFQVIQFPHRGMIVIINQLDNYMLEIVVHPNFPFIRASLKAFRDMVVGSFKNGSLMGNLMIPPPLSFVEVSY